MIPSRKKDTFWSSVVYPNRFPAHTIHNLSLAKTASTFALWIPFHSAHENVNFVYKEDPDKTIGGEDYGQSSSFKDMQGKGADPATEAALHHPIKVLLLFRLNNK